VISVLPFPVVEVEVEVVVVVVEVELVEIMEARLEREDLKDPKDWETLLIIDAIL